MHRLNVTGYLFLFSETERSPTIKIQKATSQEELISLPQEKIPEKVLPLTTKKSDSPAASFPKKYKRNYSKKSFASLSDQNNKSSEKASFFLYNTSFGKYPSKDFLNKYFSILFSFGILNDGFIDN